MARPVNGSPHASVDRRSFFTRSGAALGATWLGVSIPLLEACGREARRAAAEGRAFRALTAPEAEALDALTARIIPTDDTPGAREAGVVRFIDQALAETYLPGIEEPLRAVIALADDRAARFGATSFAALPEGEQDGVLGELAGMEESPFGTLRTVTMMGMFSNPEYGGNRDEIGWKLLGFQQASGFQPPFGEYDRSYRELGGGA